MNSSGIESYLKLGQFDFELLSEVEEYGCVLGSFSTDAFLLDCKENHSVVVYELDNKKYWVRKYEGEVKEFREI